MTDTLATEAPAGIDRSERYLVVGAGSSGLVAAKRLLERGVPADVVERQDDVGGLWFAPGPYGRVARSTHLVSSKQLTAYRDFPMPVDYPDYPSHEQVLEYFRAYARYYGLYDRIEFGERW
jgi:cation diffusion facilitator CzcD-associated flavoprotein CzcO